ncbi:hypothetical protein [Fervidobacterium sp.]
MVEKLPEEFEEFYIDAPQITPDEEVAKKLNEMGVIRVLIIQDKNE